MIDLPHVLSSKDYAGNLDDDRRQLALNRRAIEFALDAGDEYAMDDEIISQSGKINGAATARGISANIAYAHHLDRLGESYELLDAAQMQARCGTGYYRHGLFTPGTVMLHPAAYVRGLAEGLFKPSTDLRGQSGFADAAQPWYLAGTDSRWCCQRTTGDHGHEWTYREFWLFQTSAGASVPICLYERDAGQ